MRWIIVCSVVFIVGFSPKTFGVRTAAEKVTWNGYPTAHGGTPGYHYDYSANDRMRDRFRGRIGHPHRRAYHYGVYHQHYPYIPFKTKAPYQGKFEHTSAAEEVSK